MKYGAIILLKKYKHPGIKYSFHFSLFVFIHITARPCRTSGTGVRCGYVRLTPDLHPMICRSRRPIKMAKNTAFALKLLSILNYCPSAFRFLCVTFNEAEGRFSFLTYLAWFIAQLIESCLRNSEFCHIATRVVVEFLLTSCISDSDGWATCIVHCAVRAYLMLIDHEDSKILLINS